MCSLRAMGNCECSRVKDGRVDLRRQKEEMSDERQSETCWLKRGFCVAGHGKRAGKEA